MNCTHYQVFQWTDPLTGAEQEPQCWTCGSKDVKRVNSVFPADNLRKIPLGKLKAILKAKGIEVPDMKRED
jgi:hypothetical protein